MQCLKSGAANGVFLCCRNRFCVGGTVISVVIAVDHVAVTISVELINHPDVNVHIYDAASVCLEMNAM